ncbi:DnaJ domain-containing protein, putative [Eimeria acervulina]|uniref:DnaJ domain-containing protein, putative n=1 Tax=Eimeria acervulina TaxID=5801 RepID=U6GY97_EIMAC|nr:DnaJ domain-containing protein, putative [Eimeria acervulina]CDI84213.1 DnaJ domain-containing protein, putative [Eimeria acervulina]
MDASRGQLPAGLGGKCPYSVLGLCASAEGKPLTVQEAAADEASVAAREALSSKAIGTAYRRAALKAHPDKNKGKETEAAAAFLVVNLAFAFLSSAEQREAYHQHLRTLLGLRQQREQQRLRWTERDKQKQQFKAELERKESAARHDTPRVNQQEEELQRIREQNAAFIKRHTEQRQKQIQETFREHSAQLLQQHQMQRSTSFSHAMPATHATHAGSSAETGAEETLEDILFRSVVLQWSVPKEQTAAEAAAASACNRQHEQPGAPAVAKDAAADIKSDTAAGAGTAETAAGAGTAKAAAAAGTAEAAAEGGEAGDAEAAATPATAAAGEAAADAPTPASLCALLWAHGAVDLCLFSRSRGLACVSFSSRERAIEAALLLQRQRKKEANSQAERLTVKLANKAKGFDLLLQKVRSAAAASDQQQQQQQQQQQHDEADDLREAAELAAETEEAAGAFASALAAAQSAAAPPAAAAAPPGEHPSAAPTAEQPTLNGSTFSQPNPSSSSSSSRGSMTLGEATSAAAAFGLGAAAASAQPISGAAASILEYVRSCSSRGMEEVQQQHAEAENDRGWEWVGGSKVAASMSMQQLEAAAFGELHRKKQQQQQQ